MFNFLNPVWLIENFLTLNFGGSSAPTPTNTTVQNTNIPDYAQPYVMNMLGATESQLFNTDSSGNITGFNQYQPYSTNPQNYVAGFSPLQKNAQQSAANMQMPGQFGQGSQLAGMAGMGSMGLAGQANNVGNNYFGMATNPGTVNQFMNPYLQNALDPALAEARRQYGITGQQEQGNATQAGAFGGSREALMAAENNRNMNTGMNQMIGQGYNQAYNQAQQNILSGNQLGLQGYQTGLQGYGQGIQAANAMGQLGTQQEAAQQGIINTQNTLGGQEQQNQQNIINQAVQNYANAQQYPMMQLGMMSNMLRGLPMQGMTTQQYQAQPSMTNQLVGLTGALANTAPTKTSKKGGILEADGVKKYNIGGSLKANIASLTTPQLQQALQTAASNIEKGDIQAELANRAAGSSPTIAVKKGGILSFEEGSKGTVGDDAQAEQIAQDRRNLKSGTLGLARPIAMASDIVAGPYNYLADSRLGRALGVPTVGDASNYPTQHWLDQKQAAVNTPTKGGYVPSAADAAPPSAAQVAATNLAMQGTQQQQPQQQQKNVGDKPKPAPQMSPGILAAMPQAPTMDKMNATSLAELSPEQRAAFLKTAQPSSIEEEIQQQKDLETKYIDPKIIEARAQDRKNALQSQSSIESELAERRRVANQNMWLRIGSTPGPLLAALTKSWAEKNLEDVQDTQWGRDAKAKANELVAKLNDSDYLIQKGHIDAGMKAHDEAVKELQRQSEEVAKLMESKNTNQVSLYGHQVQAVNDANRNKIAQGELGVQEKRLQNEPNKQELQDQKTWASVYDSALKTYSTMDPATAEEKAIAAANQAC